MSPHRAISLAVFHSLLHSLHTTIRDPPSWITLKLTLLSLTQKEHLELFKEIKTIDLQIESLERLIGAFEDGVGDGKHLKKVISWKANLSAILESRKPPSPFDAIDRSELPLPLPNIYSTSRDGKKLSRRKGLGTRGEIVLQNLGGKLI
ncbi:hypothetical protein JCM3765_007603 [Sporobolomyces pararoseus]